MCQSQRDYPCQYGMLRTDTFQKVVINTDLSIGVSKANFRLDNSLGITRLKIAAILILTVYCSERIEIKINKGKRHMS